MPMMSPPTTGAAMGLTMTEDTLTLRRHELYWGITTALLYIRHTCLVWVTVTSGTDHSTAGYREHSTRWGATPPCAVFPILGWGGGGVSHLRM